MHRFYPIVLICLHLFPSTQASSQGTISFPLNILQSLRGGSATFTSSPIDIGGVETIFDDNPNTLARSANVNPMVLTLEFKNPVEAISFKVNQGFGNGWFTLEVADNLKDLNGKSGSYLLVVKERATTSNGDAGIPVLLNLSVAITKKVFRLTVRKTTGDNYVHLWDWMIYGKETFPVSSLHARDTATIPLFPTWKIYLSKPDFWKVPSIYALSGKDTTTIANTSISWSVVDTSIAAVSNGELLAKNPGNTFLVGRVDTFSVRIPIRVAQPAKPVERVKDIDPFLTTPANCFVKEMPVVVIVFLPTLDGQNIDLKETQYGLPISQQTVALAKEYTLGINKHTKFTLEEGSKFRGFQNKGAIPYLGYRVVDYFIVYESVPRGFPSPDSPSFTTDYDQIIKRFNGKHYVDDLGVKEFWILGVHTDEVALAESNMSSPTTGDVSNSYRWQDDMPVYSKTYVTYNYNITRSGNEAVHNHGHQLEAMMSHAAGLQDGNTSLFWEKFAGAAPGQPPIGRVGDTHHPPNTRKDYDYANTSLVNSDIFDWKPDGGKETLVNVTTWDTLPYNWPSSMYPDREFNLYVPGAESNWYLMWMQSFPGYGSRIPYGNRYMSNWWKMVHDWDTFHKAGLHQAAPEPLAPTCAASFSYAFSLKEICAGGSFQVPYSSSQIYFPPENEFLVELSDTLGGFKTPLVIGRLKGVASSGQITASLPDNLPFGNKYRIRISNNSGNIEKTASAYFRIAAVPDIIQTVEESCLGRCDGAATVVNQNAYPFQYAWSNGQKGISATNLCPGDHTLIITGNNGCRTERLFSIASGKASPKQTSLGAAINVNQWIQTGKATVSTSPIDIGSAYEIFDNNPTSLARSAGVNPMVITIQFKDVIKTSGFKITQGWANGYFTLEAANTLADLEHKSGSYLLLEKERPTSVTSQNTDIGIPVLANHAVERKVFRLTVQKSTGDNYVHLWDWAIFGKESYSVDRIKHQPDTLILVPGQTINLNEAAAALTPKIMAYSGKDSFLLDPACVRWSVSNAAILRLDTLQRKVTALQTGSAALLATISSHQAHLPVKVVAETLEAKPDSLTFGPEKSTQSISLASNTTWTASASGSWLSVSPATGSHNGSVMVTCEQNLSTASRGGFITISTPGLSPRTVVVTQAGAAAMLNVSLNTLNFTAGGENKTFEISSNTSWSVSESLEWLSVNPVSGSDNSTLTVVCLANTSTAARSGVITVTAPGVSQQTITVNQAGAAAILNVSLNTMSFAAGGENKTFEISSNTSWSVSESLEWLSVNPVSGSTNGTVTVACLANTSASTRNGVITVSANGATPLSIAVVQQGEIPVLSLSPDTLSFISGGGNKTLDIASNASWAVSESLSWVSVNPAAGNGNGAITIACEANASTAARSGAITVSAPGLSSQTITVIQGGAAATLGISQILLNFPSSGGDKAFGIASNTSWSVSESLSWLSVNPEAGNNNGNITVKCEQNLSTASRGGVITITAPGLSPRTVAVTQAGATAALNVSLNALSFAAGGENKTFEISSNTSWSVSESLEWLSVNPVSGSNNGTLTVACLTNTSTAARSGVITVSAPGVNPQTIAVAQAAAPIDTLQYFKLPAEAHSGPAATLVVLAENPSTLLQEGDEIGVFAADTFLCAAGKFKNENLSLTVRGDDPAKPGRQGIQPGEIYKLRIWKRSQNRTYPLLVQYIQGDSIYQESDTETIKVLDLVTSTVELMDRNALRLFPNPSSGQIHIVAERALDGPVCMRIFQANGQVILQENESGSWVPGDQRSLDLSHLSEGIYVIQVISQEGVWLGKVSLVR